MLTEQRERSVQEDSLVELINNKPLDMTQQQVEHGAGLDDGGVLDMSQHVEHGIDADEYQQAMQVSQVMQPDSSSNLRLKLENQSEAVETPTCQSNIEQRCTLSPPSP